MENALHDQRKNQIGNLSVSDQNSFSFFAFINQRLIEFHTCIIATNLMASTLIDNYFKQQSDFYSFHIK